MSLYMEIKRVADEGLAAGEALWSVIEAAGRAGLRQRQLVNTFGLALDAITEEMPAQEGRLFGAYAMKAIPIVLLDGAMRAVITRTANNAWSAYYDHLADQEREAALDHAHDLRSERIRVVGVIGDEAA